MIHLTTDSAIESAKKAVALMGEDYIYHTPDGKMAAPDVKCKYVDINKNAPSCIVGHILHDHGVPLETISIEGIGAESMLKKLRKSEILNFTGEASHFLNKLQEAQDVGEPWGEALEQAMPLLA
jgi:hypothetical protein